MLDRVDAILQAHTPQEGLMTSADVKATLLATEVRTLSAKAIPQDFRISVALPRSYAAHPEQYYPTIYLTDATVFFGMVVDITRVMPLCGQFPETIVFGIGYQVDEPLDEALTQWENLRARDLTPVAEISPESSRQTGGAAEFLSFIQTDLIPTIEREYRADPASRVLAGYSFGGLFVLYALFHQPHLFKSYIAGSPSLYYGDRVTFTYEDAYAAAQSDLPVHLYLGIGEEEEQTFDGAMVSNFYQFAARLESRKYEGLVLTRRVVENCVHCASAAPVFQAGIQAVLSERQQ
jgi:predicted alpha/beta superfamily hydrolase